MHVLIAGGTGELGRTLAARLIHQGQRVTLFGRDPARAEAARAAVPGAVVLTGDAHDPAGVAAVLAAAKRLAPVDVYIHNAGLPPMPEQPIEHWREGTLAATVADALRGVETLLRLAQPRRALLLYGNLALTPLPGRAASLASRMALLGLFRVWETERPGRRFTLVKMGKTAGRWHRADELAEGILAALAGDEAEVTLGDSYGA